MLRHPDDGRLRRFSDEPSSFGVVEAAHITGCTRCRRRLALLESARDDVAQLLMEPSSVPPKAQDIELALARVRRTAGAHDNAVLPTAPARELSPITTVGKKKDVAMLYTPAALRDRGRTRTVAVAATVAGLAAALTLTPIGSLAQSLLTIFEPQQVAPLAVTTTDLRGLPNLQRYGDLVQSSNTQTVHVVGASAAASVAGIAVRTPSILPPGVPTTARYDVMSLTSASFTFSAVKAAAAAASLHKTLPPMPSGLDGARLRATAGPAVVAVYGDTSNIATLLGSVVVIVQAKAPIVTSTGATVTQIEDYLLAQPGVSPSLAASIRAIGNPQSTLPIPIPIDMATSQPITVQGVQGVVVGDNTGLGAAIIWQKDGIIYGVAGTTTTPQLLAVANSLH